MLCLGSMRPEVTHLLQARGWQSVCTCSAAGVTKSHADKTRASVFEAPKPLACYLHACDILPAITHNFPLLAWPSSKKDSKWNRFRLFISAIAGLQYIMPDALVLSLAGTPPGSPDDMLKRATEASSSWSIPPESVKLLRRHAAEVWRAVTLHWSSV